MLGFQIHAVQPENDSMNITSKRTNRGRDAKR
jgi:hypothetical protein